MPGHGRLPARTPPAKPPIMPPPPIALSCRTPRLRCRISLPLCNTKARAILRHRNSRGMTGMARRWGLGLLLGAGIGGAAWAQTPATFDGQYVGELRLTKTVGG